jgi:hypothetical protein
MIVMKKIYLYLCVAVASLLIYSTSKAQCPYPTPVVNVVNGVICNGAPAILSVPDDYDSYQWYWGTVPVPVAATDYSYWAVTEGSYTLQVVLNGCTATTAPVFVSSPAVQPLNFPDTLYSCTNELLVSVDPLLYDQFLWSTGETTNSKLITQSGFYGVGAGISALSCGVADTFWVELNMPSPSVSITTIGNNPFCQNANVILESDNVSGNQWSNGETTQAISVTSPGLYTVTVENYYGCTATASVQVDQIICSSLIGQFCPNYNLVQTSAIICQPVVGATQYEWRFSQNGNVYATKFSTLNYIVLHSVSPQISWGNIYQVDVKPYVPGQVTSFGAICEIGLINQPVPNTVPLTQLRSQDCGKLNYRLNIDNRLVANSVYQAISYEFQFSEVVSGNVVASKIVQSPVCFLNTVTPTLPVPAQYNVKVRVLYGGVWGNFGNACLIGIIGINKEEQETDPFNEADELLPAEYLFSAGAYPNPYTEGATLTIFSTEIETMSVNVYDITGKIVDQFRAVANENFIFGEAYNSGLYFIDITNQKGETQHLKVIKN